MLLKWLIRNCNRYIILLNGEPVGGKYVIIVRNKTTTTNSVVVMVSRIRCRHVLAGMDNLHDLCTCMILIICGIFVESKYIAIWLLTWLSCCWDGNVCYFFVNVCNCCNCLSVPLLEFSVTQSSVIRWGTRWAVRLLVCVIRPLPLQCYPTCLPPTGSKYTNFRR